MAKYPNKYGSFLIFKKRLLSDFTFSTDFLAGSGGVFGFVFRYKDIYNYYAVELNHEDGFKRIIKMVQGKYTVLKEVKDGGFSLNYWLNFTLKMKDNEVSVTTSILGSKKSSFVKNLNLMEFGYGK